MPSGAQSGNLRRCSLYSVANNPPHPPRKSRKRFKKRKLVSLEPEPWSEYAGAASEPAYSDGYASAGYTSGACVLWSSSRGKAMARMRLLPCGRLQKSGVPRAPYAAARAGGPASSKLPCQALSMPQRPLFSPPPAPPPQPGMPARATTRRWGPRAQTASAPPTSCLRRGCPG